MHLEIVRDPTLSNDTGTFGELLIDGKHFAYTCEQPWRDNAKGSSCIPVGDYTLLPYDLGAHGKTVVFHNPALNIYGTPDMIPPDKKATGRSLCEIHSANWPKELRGCVAPGVEIKNIPPNGTGVTSSKNTVAKLMALWGDRKGLTATIR